ncbi:phospholipase D-like domain-containing protein [Georgenia sp. Z1491]|uniref:phospholipase D-like domain-containing protein n=1 Tax=Georgenia sp. Z1491 TaxID=3416707 RepID=UPI003CF556A4
MPRRTFDTLLRTGVRVAAVTAAAQLTAAGGIMAVDHLRKLREPLSGEFPATEPVDLDVHGSQMKVFTYGQDLYEDMLAAIEGATRSVYFETFIWKRDDTGRRFKEALEAAARRGVDTYVVFDSWGNLNQGLHFYRFADLPHLHVRRFPLIRPGLLIGNMRQTGRDHRKLLVVDETTGYVGGYNIGDLYATTWRDTHLRVTGPAVWELANAFVDFWNDHRTRRLPELPDPGAREWLAQIEARSNTPHRMLFPVRGMYLDALDRAVDTVDITMAYFIPDREILRALTSAAARGVRVRVIIPHRTNHVLADWVSRPYYDDLLQAGVELWLFKDAMVHSKTMSVDGRWTTIGTANIDRMSLQGNFEVNLEVHDDGLAEHMARVFDTDLTNSMQLTLEEWRARGWWRRPLERLVRPLGPLL